MTLKMNEEAVFCFGNCSKLLWEKNVLVIKEIFCQFKADGLYIYSSKNLLLEQFIQTEYLF